MAQQGYSRTCPEIGELLPLDQEPLMIEPQRLTDIYSADTTAQGILRKHITDLICVA